MTQHPTTPAPQPDQPPAPDLPAPSPADDVLEMEPTIEGEDFSRVAFTQAAGPFRHAGTRILDLDLAPLLAASARGGLVRAA